MSECITYDRRRFLRNAGASLVAAEIAGFASAPARTVLTTARTQETAPGAQTSFASLKHIDAGVLNVGYAEAGSTDGPAVILLHGWPYDIHS